MGSGAGKGGHGHVVRRCLCPRQSRACAGHLETWGRVVRSRVLGDITFVVGEQSGPSHQDRDTPNQDASTSLRQLRLDRTGPDSQVPSDRAAAPGL